MKKVNNSIKGKRILMGLIIAFFILSLVFFSIQPVIGQIQRNNPSSSLNCFNSLNSNIEFSTFLGGNEPDMATDIAFTSNDSCYAVGYTSSNNFPTQDAYNNTFGGIVDAYITKFSSEGALRWSTYFGGNDTDICNSVDTYSDGSCYVTGYTNSKNFPVINAFNSTWSGFSDAFVAKFAANGTLLWSTYLGGNDYDQSYSIAVASDGSCFVTGWTSSINFPTLNAYDNDLDIYDAFIAKFSSEGVLLWSTYFGGSGIDGFGGCDIAVDFDDGCYIIGSTTSEDFPVLNAFDDSFNGARDLFIARFNTNGSLLMSTYFGGEEVEDGMGVAVASNGSYYVTGTTFSLGYPTTNNGYDHQLSGESDIFVTKFRSDNSLLWSTYLGGSSHDYGSKIAIGSEDNCYIVGSTTSIDYPTKNAYDKTFGGEIFAFDGVLTIFSSTGSLLWSTFLGGEAGDACSSVTIGTDDSCFVIGTTASAHFPTLNAFCSTFNGGLNDAFITKFTIKIADNRALVIGLAIGIPLIVISASVTAYILIRKKRKVKVEYTPYGK